MFLITYNDDQTFDEIKQSHVKTISEHSGLTISPKEFKKATLPYEYSYDVLDIDL